MAAAFRDYYEILGISREATAAEIKKAFRKRARDFHPDVAEDKNTAEEKFKEINEAYQVLGDPEKRKKYDALGAAWDQPAGGAPQGSGAAWSGGGTMPEGFEFEGTGFSDFFEQYFSEAGGRRAAGFGGGFGSAGPVRGPDIEGDLMVTLEEAFTGSMRTISLRKSDPRSGQVSSEEVQVRIPSGITEGQRLRIPGHGGRGSGGNGDLFLRVRLAAHPDFRVKGRDIYRNLPLAPWEAVLGTTLSVDVPGGKSVQVRIPAGTGAEDQLRLKGYGLPGGKRAGDFFVEISIESPPHVGSEERALWEQLREISTFKPREH